MDANENVKVIGLDRDPVAFSYAKEFQKQYPDRFTPLLGRFSELPRLLQEQNITSGTRATFLLLR